MNDTSSDDDVQGDQPIKVFKPNKSLREKPLARALRTYVISTVCKSYLTLAIRVLWKEKDFSDMYARREQLKNILKAVKEIKMVIGCVTAMEKGEETDTCIRLA